MPTPQSQNFREMYDAVLKKYPAYDPILCKQDINDILRVIMARRPWSGLVKYGILSVPQQYTVGTVTATQYSSVVDGVATSWLFDDLVNTTLQDATVITGIIDIKPAAMTSIIPGRWMTIDGGNAGEEAVFVISIDTESQTFRARTTKTHSAAVTIKCGSMAGRQFRINSQTPFVTAAGFTSATRMLLDQNWPSATLTGQPYELTMVFVSLGRDVKEVLTMVNPDRQYQFRLNAQKAEIDAEDPRRAVSQMPYKLAFHETDLGGAPLFELWPRPTSQAAYPFFYIRSWTPLVEENDLLPNGIRSDIIVKMARAEASRWPGHKKIDGGIYFDARLSESLIRESEVEIQYMKNEDDSTAIMQMIYSYKRWQWGGPSPDYYQTDSEAFGV